jgi:hypothetical protein
VWRVVTACGLMVGILIYPSFPGEMRNSLVLFFIVVFSAACA